MKIRARLALLILLTSIAGAQATDRDAVIIDSFAVNVADLDDIDSIGASLWGRTAIGLPREDWSLLFGGAFDELSPDNEHNIDAWTVGIGLQYYISSLTTVSGVGSYTRYDQGSGTEDKDAKAATATIRHRFAEADASISPFLKGAVTFRDRTTFSSYDPELEDDTFSEFLVTAGGGAEFRMNDDWSFVFELGYVAADASADNAEDLDGFTGSVAMQYYWPKPPL